MSQARDRALDAVLRKKRPQSQDPTSKISLVIEDPGNGRVRTVEEVNRLGMKLKEVFFRGLDGPCDRVEHQGDHFLVDADFLAPPTLAARCQGHGDR